MKINNVPYGVLTRKACCASVRKKENIFLFSSCCHGNKRKKREFAAATKTKIRFVALHGICWGYILPHN